LSTEPSTAVITWRGTDEQRTETAEVELRDDGLHATGVQQTPAYRLEYELDVGPGWVTRRLRVRCGERAIDAGHVRYVALDGEFTALLDVDPDGLVRASEHLAARTD